MRRRDFLRVLGCAAAWPMAAHGQQRTAPVVGVLWHAGSAKEEGEYFTTFVQGVRDRGYVDGESIRLEHRYANEEYERFNNLAVELAAFKVDVLVAVTQPAALAAQKATKEIPIVFILAPDPIGSKLVSNLAKPGGNITGLSNMAIDVTAKRLQILRDALPALTRSALLVNSSDQLLMRRTIEIIESAARSLNVMIKTYEVRSPDDLDRVFPMIATDGNEAVLTGYDAMFTNERKRLADLALSLRLPLITQSRPGAVAGAFMSYGTDSKTIFRRAGIYIDKILKGERPGDLPIEQPTQFELLINLKTAKALGISVPATLLASATQVIE